MTTRQDIRVKLNEMEQLVADAEAQMVALREEYEKLPSRPTEPDREPNIVTFVKTYGKGKSAKEYRYTAQQLPVNGDGTAKWVMTTDAPGRRPNAKTWEELCDFILQGEKEAPKLQLVDKITDIEW